MSRREKLIAPVRAALPPEPHEGESSSREGSFLTIAEASAFLNLSRSKLYQMLDAGEIPYARFSGCRRIPRRALEEFVERSMVTA